MYYFCTTTVNPYAKVLPEIRYVIKSVGFARNSVAGSGEPKLKMKTHYFCKVVIKIRKSVQ